MSGGRGRGITVLHHQTKESHTKVKPHSTSPQKPERMITRFDLLKNPKFTKKDIIDTEHGLVYGGRLTLVQDISTDTTQRFPPDVLENLLIAPTFTQCVRRATLAWTQNFMPKKACILTLPLLFKVYRPIE